MFRIAVTGTPGTGKTSLCEFADVERTSVLELAERHAAASVKESGAPVEIDIPHLSKILESEWRDSPNALHLIDGHLSHLLPVDAAVLLRCEPGTLRLRLEQRNWPESKVVENVECELLGGPWSELLDMHLPFPCLELDTTHLSTNELWLAIRKWIASGANHIDGEIDWIAESDD